MPTLSLPIPTRSASESIEVPPLRTRRRTRSRVGLVGSTQVNNSFNGLIDEVAVYNRALSEAEILANFEAAFTPPPQPIIPEPSTAALLLMGAATLFARRRRPNR